jgi:hypothetical protein
LLANPQQRQSVHQSKSALVLKIEGFEKKKSENEKKNENENC